MRDYSIYFTTRADVERLKDLITPLGLSCEVSGCGSGYNCAITCTPEDAARVNDLLNA